jgi:hypothetical protein
MANDRNAGKKPKFKKTIKTKIIRTLIPVEKEMEILESINEICKNELWKK